MQTLTQLIDIEIFEKIFNLLNIVLVSAGGLGTWLYMAKYNKNKNISSAVKDTKVNNVDGDKALVDQLDMLLSKVAAMSESMLKVQAELSELTNLIYSYKSAIRRMKANCNEFCKDAEFCRRCIDNILIDLNLLDKNEK